jgi:hypothetical protein
LADEAGRKSHHQKKQVKRDLPAAAVVLPGLAGMGILFGLFGISVSDYGRFLFGLFVFVYAPGRAVLDLLRIRRPPLASPILTAVLGMAASTLLNKYARLLNVEILFGCGIAAAAAYVLLRGIRRIPSLWRTSMRLSRTGAILGGCCLLILTLLAVDNFRNGIARPDGTIAVRMHYYDGFIRNAVIGELSHSVPPQMPFAAGVPLGYHYGMDLFVSLFVRYLGLGVFDLVHRFSAVFFWGIFFFAVFLFTRTFYDSVRTGVWAAVLVVFGGGGWTWVATVARGTPLGGNPFYALYIFDGLGVNSLVPAFALAFGGLTALTCYLRERTVSALVLSAGLLAAAVEFKIFLGPPLLGAFLVTGIAAGIIRKDWAIFRAGAAFLAGLLPLAGAALASGGGPAYRYALRFIDWPGRVLADLRLETWADLWTGAISGGGLTVGGVAVVLAAVGLTFLGAFGPSVAAIPRLVRDFFAGPKDAPRFFVSGLTAACIFYFYVFEVRLGSLDRTILNVYVFYFGLVLLLIAAADVFRRIAENRSRILGFALGALAVGLTLPNAVLFLGQKTGSPETRVFSAVYLEASRWLSRNIPKDAVILQPSDIRHLCYFADRRVVLDDSVNSYLDFHLTREEIGRRRDGINRFFGDPKRRADILESYGVTFVLRSNDRPFPEESSERIFLDPKDPTERSAAVPRATSLTRVFGNEGFTVYRVDR